MSVGNIARVLAVAATCFAAAASATSSSNEAKPAAGPGQEDSPPQSQDMEASRALGLWRSTFGAVKIEPDNSHGGLSSGSVQGIWMYQRQGQDVVGYFAGNLHGNVLQFRWQEPSSPPLTGEGYLVFDVEGRQYAGRWWSDQRDRVGDWNGWRQPPTQGASRTDPGQFGGQNDAYGQSPYRRPSPYQQSPSPYPGQPPYQPGQPPPYPGQPPPYQPSPQQPDPYRQQSDPAQQPPQPPIRYN